MKSLYKILILVMGAGLLSQCAQDGEYDHPINKDNIPDVPILFPGTTTHGANPFTTVAWGTDGSGAALPAPAANNIAIVISVPDDSPLKIREITKMIAGATSITPGILVTRGNYLAAPIAVNGTTVTINTTLSEFNGKPTTVVPAAERVTQANVNGITATSPYVERAFMFLVTLDDGSTVVTQQLRMRVVK
jgi:hypothetical protein